MIAMGRYLHEETDEYQKLKSTRALLVGTAALLGMLVVNDFLRSFTPSPGIAPFWAFLVFAVAVGITQAAQSITDKAQDDKPAA